MNEKMVSNHEVLPADLSKSSLIFFFHHVFLPPKLPTGDDSSPTDDDVLIGFVQTCLTAFAQTVPESTRNVVFEALTTLKTLRHLRDDHGQLHEDALRKAFCSISEAGNENTAISVQIKAQNAGLIVRKVKDGAVFEMFELSPHNAAVMETRGRLVRSFPAFAVQVDSAVLTDPNFQSSIANTMATMSHQRAPDTTPQVIKAFQSHDEERDTTDPKVVTELLTSILLSFGSEASVQSIRKNTREDVSYDNSKLPWRRSPLWLLVRVTLQLTFQRADPSGGKTYKKFMLYLLSKILEAAEAQYLDSDILYTMSAKIARRLTKLGDSESGAWVETLRKGMYMTSTTLDDRWASVRQAAEVPIDLSKLSTLSWDRDMHLDLPKLDEFLSSINRRGRLSTSGSFSPKSQFQSLSASTLPRIHHSDDVYRTFQLTEVERWVAVNMDRWIQTNMKGPQTCEDLANFLRGYHELAQAHYLDSPEGTSRMLLTVLEIWTALDKSATSIIPLMWQYRPQIPINIFKGLLLGQIRDMERLFQAEKYVLFRDEVAGELGRPSILSSFGTEGCFPVHYFDQSTRHQELLTGIENRAELDKQKKLEELRSLKVKYRALMKLYSDSSCQYDVFYDMRGKSTERHSSSCDRCQYHYRANNLSIMVHEWPLPSNLLQAKSTVFELDPPSAFRWWRDTTVYLIGDVLKYYLSKTNMPRARYPLADYQGLSQWQKAPKEQRVYPLSEVKPHINTHRKEKAIVNLLEDDVCVNNGLQLRYFDGIYHVFLSEFSPSDLILERCTFKLPSRSAVLKPFILRTHGRPSGKTPNEVLAEQNICPSHLSIAEGRALMSLSYGYEIRWLELLTQLASPRLDFGKPETATFLLQLSLQAGPNTAGVALRDSHQCLASSEFCLQLSKALDARINRIEKNPEAFFALWSFTALAARGLTINRSSRECFLGILARCRDISYQWVKLLYEKSLAPEDEDQRRQFRDMMFDIALVCLDSFNVDQVHFETIFSSPKAVSVLVEMSIRVQDNVELRKPVQQDPLQAVLFDRWQSLMYRSSKLVSEQAVRHGTTQGIDLAVERCWPAYHRKKAWHRFPTAEHWLKTSSLSLQVMYNTFTGELLVGGSPLSRLPTSYKTSPLYQPLFGRCAIDVRPSDLAGMSFLSQGTFCGREVHFGMHAREKEGELLLHTHYQGSNHDLVPSRVLANYIPEALVRDFVHWYHYKTGEIEFRPRSTPWTTDPNGWLLKSFKGTWTLTRGTRHIVNPLSDTARHISAILEPLDTVMHMHILYNQQAHQVEIHLPRLKLDFYLQSTVQGYQTLWSQQFQRMCIDENQSIGTLVGLRNKLVLRGETQTGVDNRMILIPEGETIFRRSAGGHVVVSVIYGTATRVQSYRIDAQLGRLTDNGTLQSKLFLSYMHALTSYCIPDPFTKHTGTEQALMILESAAVRSTNTLTEENVELLTRIAELSPRRLFYPANMRVMQSVIWKDNLSYIAQSGWFYIHAQDIIKLVQRLQFLYPNSAKLKDFRHTHPDLVDREAIRSASLYVAGSVSAAFTTDYDQTYESRDRGQSSPSAQRAARIATKISSRSQSLEFVPAKDTSAYLYDCLLYTAGKLLPMQYLGPRDFQYDGRWLAETDVVIAGLWCRMHHGLWRFTLSCPFEAATFLASLAYSSPDIQHLVQVVYAFAANPSVAAVPLPDIAEYDLGQGYEINDDTLFTIIRRNAIDISDSPEFSISRKRRESSYKWDQRRGAVLDRSLLSHGIYQLELGAEVFITLVDNVP